MDNINSLVTRSYDLWNAHDRDGWVGCFNDDVAFKGPGGLAGQGLDAARMILFLSLSGSGTWTSTGGESTETDTITGGTGRFAGASGMYTETISSVIVSVTATTETSRFTAALKGQISY